MLNFRKHLLWIFVAMALMQGSPSQVKQTPTSVPT